MISVEIDRNSGFCGGVIRAISTAEEYLRHEGGRMYSLGAVVHNEEELARLEAEGLVALDREDLVQMDSVDGAPLMIRAHGEPPEVYAQVAAKGFKVIDCTCPVVLRLQKDIREAYARLHEGGSGGKLVIFGKIGHPEVLGLVGQVGGDAIVVEDLQQLKDAFGSGRLSATDSVELFSQTTMSPVVFASICEWLGNEMRAAGLLTVHDTICSQVARRHKDLSEFAHAHDIIIFVSGRHSSNGKVLSDLCRSSNFRTFHISSESELQKDWFRPDDKVGVCGATSTPKWLLERIAAIIENLQ